jgi:multiple sugar transport system permease protein
MAGDTAEKPAMTPVHAKRLDAVGMLVSLLTLGLAVVWAFPICWSLYATATPAPGDSPLSVIENYRQVLFETSLGRWYVNSIVTSGGVTLIVLAISSACGYAISQINFTGRSVLWFMILASFMIPVQALIVNHFFLIYQLGLLNTWLGVILPQLIAPISVIVYKGFFDNVPDEYREAAQIDGARHWQIFLGIYLPMNWGITVALGIIVFIGAWNAFLWPFLAVTKTDLMNVTVGATESWSGNVNELITAVLVALPVAVLYLLFQRKVTDAISFSTGIKG